MLEEPISNITLASFCGVFSQIDSMKGLLFPENQISFILTKKEKGCWWIDTPNNPELQNHPLIGDFYVI